MEANLARAGELMAVGVVDVLPTDCHLIKIAAF
jgi:hypothetical protein